MSSVNPPRAMLSVAPADTSVTRLAAAGLAAHSLAPGEDAQVDAAARELGDSVDA